MKTRENTIEENQLISRCFELFEYDKERGELRYRSTAYRERVDSFEVGGKGTNGYMVVGIDDKKYLVHRLIFAMHWFYFPELVDHRDRNKLNNRIDNLRNATHSENNLNKAPRRDSKSGIPGITWSKAHGKWMVHVNKDKKQYHVGVFDDLQQAADARLAKHAELFGPPSELNYTIINQKNYPETNSLRDML